MEAQAEYAADRRGDRVPNARGEVRALLEYRLDPPDKEGEGHESDREKQSLFYQLGRNASPVFPSEGFDDQRRSMWLSYLIPTKLGG